MLTTQGGGRSFSVFLTLAIATGLGSVSPTAGGEPTPKSSSTANAQAAAPPLPSTEPGGGAIQREYKGKFDSIGPFRLHDLDGRIWTDRDLRGKVVIVVQWAAWCGSCVDGFPDVQETYRKLLHSPSVAVVSLDMDEDPKKIDSFLKEFRKEYSFPVLLAWERFKIKALPMTWILDRDGYLREALAGSGPGWTAKVLDLARAVENRPPVSALPPAIVNAQREQNERDAVETR